VVFLRPAIPGAVANALWRFDVTTGAEWVLLDPDHLDAAHRDVPDAEKARRERARERGSGVVAYDADTALSRIVCALGGVLYRIDTDDGTLEELTAAEGAFDPRLQPEGDLVAYVAGAEVRVTDGHDDRLIVSEPTAESVSWGSAEFIAGEEMGRTRGFWWSPDGQRLAVERVDVEPVQQWWIAAPVDPAAAPRAVRYPAAGTANAAVALAIIDLDGARVDVDWAQGRFEYLADVFWRDPERLTLVVQTRDQRTLAILEADAASGTVTEIHRHSDDHWVELVAGAPRWADDRLVTVADLGDARRVVVDGSPIGPSDLQVRRVVATDDAGVWVLVSPTPEQVDVAHFGFDESVTMHTSGSGVHGASVGGPTRVVSSASLEWFGARVEVWGDDGLIHTIGSYAETPVIAPRVQLRRLGSRRLATAVLGPTGHDGRSPLPVLLDPYGGPHAQRVQAARGLYLTSQWFADQGFLVVITDGRGTPARGPAFEREVHGDLAGPVLADQVDALEALADVDSRVDLDRVAIRGWSFGGYLAALAVLSRPDRFHAAIAGAPVTDWRLYDTHYTERYLGHPEDAPQAYVRSDLVPLAAQLDRPLLLIHGLADDNVVAAHTLELSRALLEAGRPHQVLPLSGVTHMTPQESVAENLLLLQLAFLRTSLGLD